jgi:hypothetical protein
VALLEEIKGEEKKKRMIEWIIIYHICVGIRYHKTY